MRQLTPVVLEFGDVLRSQVQVLESLLRLLWVIPSSAELVNDLLRKSDPGTRVGGQVDTRQTACTSVFGDLVEELVLDWPERADHEGDVVGNNYNLSSLGVLWGANGEYP